ncbi:MAG: carboxypeptidase-like regulatory domain-containing protein [Nitrospiraceae bacterium]|nr:carboxypeptidase-like regulatory domain-containing protein [Nitrospiraceae bacterium]
MRKRYSLAVIWLSMAVLLSLLLFSGCKTGDSGASTGTISGIVTSATGTAPLAGVTVSTNPNVGTAITDANGSYSMSVPAGSYQLSFALASYTSGSATANVAVSATTTVNVTMAEAASGKPTIAIAAANNNAGFANSVAVSASATDPNGDTITYIWTNATGSGSSATATTPTLDKALGGAAAPSSDPGGYVTAYKVEDRFGILPLTTDTRGTVSVTVKADDGKGQSSTASVSINAAGFQPGVKSVAVGIPLYVNSGHGDPSTWTITDPNGDAITPTLVAYGSSSQRIAFFTPTAAGKYTVSEGSNSLSVYAGFFVGAISGGAEDGKGNPSVVADGGCMICHDDATAPDEFTPWKGTLHSNFFARGLNGITSNNSACVSCHTVGYDESAAAKDDGGYYSKLTNTATNPNKWQYPATRKAGNWAAMWDPATGAPQVARMTNIQCESCHGPNNSDAHQTAQNPTSSSAFRVSYAAEVCAVCHASGTGHHLYSEWQTLNPDEKDPDAVGSTSEFGMGHSNRRAAVSMGAGSNSCRRCHAGQGFPNFLTQLNDGFIGNLGTDTVNPITIDWDASNVEPITCTACHDPHDATNPNQLRVYGTTPLLPSGFAAVGLGKGALCITCHNSRNGAQSSSNVNTYLHEDSQPTNTGLMNYNKGNPTSYSAPHTACQGDVFMGRNAYFQGAGNLPKLSKHSSVEDACVGCHMKLNPQTHLSHGAPEVSSHVFYITNADAPKLCANCHSSNVNGEALQAGVEAALEALNTQMGKNVLSKATNTVLNVIAWDPASDAYSSATGTNGQVAFNLDLTTGVNSMTTASLFEIHGQIGFMVTLTNPVTMVMTNGSTKSLSTFGIQMGNLKSAATASFPVLYNNKAGSPMVKAGWNYFLIEGDKSKGVHNPSFVQGVLNSTISMVTSTNN